MSIQCLRGANKESKAVNAVLDMTTALSVVAILLAGMTLLTRILDKSLSVREHEEYRKAVDQALDQIRGQTRRDIDRIEADMRLIDATKPTTGELQARTEALSARIELMEHVIHGKPIKKPIG